ncbi:MAG: aspartate/glutamate racemase family protein [Alphaproteobacteria bacterium]
MTLRVWHQSFTVLENLPAYEAALRAHLERIARPETEIVLHGVHPETYRTDYPGNDLGHSALFRLHGQQFILNGLKAEAKGYDVYMIATAIDPALTEIRSLLGIPVVAYGETAMHLACQLGRRFGMLFFIEALVPLVRDMARDYGLSGRLADVRFAGVTFDDVLAAFDSPGPVIDRFTKTARVLIRDGAEVIIPGEAVLCAFLARHQVTRIDDVPVLDALAATLKAAETMVDLRRDTGLEVCRRGFGMARPPSGRIEELIRFYGLDRLKDSKS